MRCNTIWYSYYDAQITESYKCAHASTHAQSMHARTHARAHMHMQAHTHTHSHTHTAHTHTHTCKMMHSIYVLYHTMHAP